MPFPITPTAAKERITGWFYNGYFEGELDDIRLYSRPLSPAEVRGLFRSEADVTVGAAAVVCDGRRDAGRATVTVRNPGRESRRVEVSGAGMTALTVELPAGTDREIAVGDVPLTPLWSSRDDLFVCDPGASLGKLTVTTEVASGSDVQQVSLAAPPTVEPLKVVVHDPWQATMPRGKTRSVQLDVELGFPAALLREGTLLVRLVSRETGRETLRRELVGPSAAFPLTLDVRRMAWGAYDIQAAFLDAAGRELVSTRRLVTVLPGGVHRIRVMNNLVSELMDARVRRLLDRPRLEFMNPRHGWVWFRAVGDCTIRLDGRDVLAVAAYGEPVEAMRLLPAGKHFLDVAGRPTDLVVRAIPALVYNVYPSSTRIAPFGANDWERLSRYVLPNTNMIESNAVDTPEHDEWLSQGRLWLANVQAPGLIDDKPWDAESLLDLWLHPGKPTAWRERPALDLSKLSGMQVDEYYSGAKAARFMPDLTRSLAQLSEHPDFEGKLWVPFMAGKFGASSGDLLLKTVLGSGWPFSEEVYLGEMPTEAENLSHIQSRFRDVAASYTAACPGSVRRMILTPMYAYLPYCTANRCPQADFRVHLDMQMEQLATDPALFGLWGVQPYRSNYVDKEILNCMGMLLRHYCIEGQTGRMLDDPYELKHAADPDFQTGLDRWQVSAAEDGSVSADSFAGYGNLQGRYPGSAIGDTFAVMTRSGKAPNALTQELRGLEPGRLYSVKVITADYADLKGGTSRKEQQVLSVGVQGADVQPGAFSYPFPSARGPHPFTRKNPFWMTYHWLRFRAQGPNAELVIGDWAKPDEPGAPIGQQTMVSFVEVQPVLEEAVR
jgi:hypothetical protein